MASLAKDVYLAAYRYLFEAYSKRLVDDKKEPLHAVLARARPPLCFTRKLPIISFGAIMDDDLYVHFTKRRASKLLLAANTGVFEGQLRALIAAPDVAVVREILNEEKNTILCRLINIVDEEAYGAASPILLPQQASLASFLSAAMSWSGDRTRKVLDSLFDATRAINTTNLVCSGSSLDNIMGNYYAMAERSCNDRGENAIKELPSVLPRLVFAALYQAAAATEGSGVRKEAVIDLTSTKALQAMDEALKLSGTSGEAMALLSPESSLEEEDEVKKWREKNGIEKAVTFYKNKIQGVYSQLAQQIPECVTMGTRLHTQLFLRKINLLLIGEEDVGRVPSDEASKEVVESTADFLNRYGTKKKYAALLRRFHLRQLRLDGLESPMLEVLKLNAFHFDWAHMRTLLNAAGHWTIPCPQNYIKLASSEELRRYIIERLFGREILKRAYDNGFSVVSFTFVGNTTINLLLSRPKLPRPKIGNLVVQTIHQSESEFVAALNSLPFYRVGDFVAGKTNHNFSALGAEQIMLLGDKLWISAGIDPYGPPNIYLEKNLHDVFSSTLGSPPAEFQENTNWLVRNLFARDFRFQIGCDFGYRAPFVAVKAPALFQPGTGKSKAFGVELIGRKKTVLVNVRISIAHFRKLCVETRLRPHDRFFGPTVVASTCPEVEAGDELVHVCGQSVIFPEKNDAEARFQTIQKLLATDRTGLQETKIDGTTKRPVITPSNMFEEVNKFADVGPDDFISIRLFRPPKEPAADAAAGGGAGGERPPPARAHASSPNNRRSSRARGRGDCIIPGYSADLPAACESSGSAA